MATLLTPRPMRASCQVRQSHSVLAEALRGMLVFGIRARGRRLLSWLSFFFVMVIVGSVVACAGTGGGRGGGILGTTPGNYMITVTATTPGPDAALPRISANTKVMVTI